MRPMGHKYKYHVHILGKNHTSGEIRSKSTIKEQ